MTGGLALPHPLCIEIQGKGRRKKTRKERRVEERRNGKEEWELRGGKRVEEKEMEGNERKDE